jgi:hypothetical protein
MNIDIILTVAVVVVALVLVVRKLMRSGCCSGCGHKGCGGAGDGQHCPPLADWRDKEKEDSDQRSR